MIDDYFTDVVTLCNPTRDQYGRTTWSYLEVNCRLQQYERIRLINGETKQARWKVWFISSLPITSATRIYFGSGLSAGDPLPGQTFIVQETRYQKRFSESHIEAIL